MPNNTAAFIRPNTKNLGDLHSGWSLYFDSHSPVFDIIKGPLPDPGEFGTVVIGGGLLPFRDVYQDWFKKNKSMGTSGSKVVAWGVGSNDGTLSADGYALFSQRENVGNWAPCPSCMSTLIDRYRNTPPIWDVVFYQNDGLEDMGSVGPRLGNHHHSFEDAIRFLSSGDCVVTTSYHGYYWATLLGRKVVVVPIRPKLKNCKWAPTYIKNVKGWREGLNVARPHPGALAEARECTLDFYKKLCSIRGSHV